MKQLKLKLTMAVLCLCMVSVANAGQWYVVDTKDFNMVYANQDGRVSVSTFDPVTEGSPIVTIKRLQSSTTWTTNNIIITPPAGLQSSYLSMLMAAVAVSGKLLVFTNDSPVPNTDVQAVNLQVYLK